MIVEVVEDKTNVLERLIISKRIFLPSCPFIYPIYDHVLFVYFNDRLCSLTSNPTLLFTGELRDRLQVYVLTI